MLRVEFPDGEWRTVVFAIDERAAPELNPYDLCSEPITPMAARRVMRMQADHIDKRRECLAQKVSAVLTNGIIKAIKSRDLRDGYKQKDEDSEPGAI